MQKTNTEKDAPPLPPPKGDEKADEKTQDPEAGEGAGTDDPAAPPRDLDTILAPLEHDELLELRAKLDKKLPKKPTGAPIQNTVLLISVISCIVSMDPTAFLLLVSFRYVSRVFGDLISAFCVFALAPALLPLALFSFSDPARKAINEAAHEMGHLLALLGGAGVKNTPAEKKTD